MKHKTLQTLIALSGALTLALAVGLLVLTPRIAEAIPVCGESPEECFCPTGGQQQTAMVWGMGASCGEAFQDAVNQPRRRVLGDLCRNHQLLEPQRPVAGGRILAVQVLRVLGRGVLSPSFRLL